LGLEARLREDGDIKAWAPAALAIVDARGACDVELGSGGVGRVDGCDRVDAVVATREKEADDVFSTSRACQDGEDSNGLTHGGLCGSRKKQGLD